MSSNDFFLEFKEELFNQFKFNFINNDLESNESIGLFENKNCDIPININIERNEDSKSFSSQKQNSQRRSNSNKDKFMPDIDDYFCKDEKLIDWLSNNNNAEILIKKEITTLLEKIFDKRYKLYPNNVCSLSEYSTYIKNKVEIYCKEDEEMSVYILYILYNNFIVLMKYVDEKVNIESMKMEDYQSIKEIIYHIGKDLKKIFKEAVNTLNKGFDFEFSNVLFVIFNEYLKKENKLKEPELVHAALIQERKELVNCFKYLNELKYTNNIKKWIKDISEEINIDVKQSKNNDNKNNENNLKNDKYINKENKNNNCICSSQPIKNKSKKNFVDSNNDEIINKLEMKTFKKENDNKDVNNFNIEDLVSYINEPKAKNNNKKKNKKKKKLKKENNVNNNEEKKSTNENNNNNNNDNDNDKEKDLIVDEFKKYIEDFTSKNNLIYPKKIEPCLSETFVRNLESY